MPGKAKKKGKKKSKKTGSKPEKSGLSEVQRLAARVKYEYVPSGEDWLRLSLCLVPWEASSITMFLNFEELVRTHSLKLSSLYSLLRNKLCLCSDQRIDLFVDPPIQGKPLSVDDFGDFTLHSLGFRGYRYNSAPRQVLFFDFGQPSRQSSLMMAESSELNMRRAEMVDRETTAMMTDIQQQSLHDSGNLFTKSWFLHQLRKEESGVGKEGKDTGEQQGTEVVEEEEERDEHEEEEEEGDEEEGGNHEDDHSEDGD